ncbi:hypothetical protein HDU93_006331 [Gonapodya sp. JEL0774]|nr:hypothetical protein HDU93_006331 [Gonapodya sp. JEL0774]
MAAASQDALIVQTEQYVRDELKSVDGSHDFSHIDRVRSVALRIARAEGADLVVVELASLLHDIKDYKYSGSEEAGPIAVKEFLVEKKCHQDLVEKVVGIVEGIGFKTSLANGTGGAQLSKSLELAVVQDADRLDAIGAIGIARCFTFGGTRHRPIHEQGDGPRDPGALTVAQYADKNRGSSVAHFFEKLLLLKDRINTCEGKRIAIERHNYMLDFLARLGRELGAGDLSAAYRVPVVDVSLPNSGSLIVNACRSWGGFVAVNHGLPTNLQADLLAAARAFFKLEEATKMALHVKKQGNMAWRGYMPCGELTHGTTDHKEGLYMGPEHGPDYPRVKKATPLFGPNQFPDKELPSLRPAALEYISAVTDLGQRFMDLLSTGLELPQTTIRDMFTKDDPIALVRLFSYSPAAKLSETGIGDHSDYGLWTMLAVDAPGLEFWNEKIGVWGQVPYIPGSIICNAGDLLDRATHGLILSPRHRVLNLESTHRTSIPFFFDPSWDAIMQTLPLPQHLLDTALEPENRAASERRWAITSIVKFEGEYSGFLKTKNGQGVWKV